MKQSRYKWVLQETTDEADVLLPELAARNLPEALSQLLWQRGIRSPEQLTAFFNPSLAELHDPYAMHDMEKAVQRIQDAVARGERILVYGDYDADGITSTTVMKEAIELIGGDVTYYLPNRFKDGYGPNMAVYQEFIAAGIQLIVTVDNGVAGHDAIQYAMEQGVHVIVTDHHELPPELPAAYAIVHPRHPEGRYPFGDLAGVGVAFKVATALLDEVPAEFLDITAIGTIADLVSLTGENRVLVKHGLEALKQTERIGLQMLCQTAKISQADITEETVGFAIGPRLNAIGRLGDASPGVELLTTFDDVEAANLATFIQQKNDERQQLVKRQTAEALEMVSELAEAPVQVLAKKGWHEGILGIVASRVVQETGRPALVLSVSEDGLTVKGSGRSTEALNLYDALSSVKEYLTHFGGHHMAAGLTLPADNLDHVKAGLADYVTQTGIDMTQGQELTIDQRLQVSEATLPFIQSLQLLAPFGTDNPSPYFLLMPEKIRQAKQIGADFSHLKFQMVTGGNELDCIAFGMGADIHEFADGNDVQVVGQLSVNEWNGFRKPQLAVADFAVEGLQVFDCRGKRGQSQMPLPEGRVAYALFDEKNLDLLKQVPEEKILLLKDGSVPSSDVPIHIDDLVLVDCPYNQQLVKELVQATGCKRLYLFVTSREEYYLNGLPTREQFGRLFKLIAQFKVIDVRYKLDDVASFLRLKRQTVIFMINVFFELGFVTIDDGLMKRVESPATRPLTESRFYQEMTEKIRIEEFFLFSDIKDIKQWFLQQEETT